MQGGNERSMIIVEFYCTPVTFLGSFNFSEKRIHPIPSRLETAARWPSDYAVVGRKPRLRDRTLVGDGFETVTLAHWPFLTREPSLCLVNSADREARMSQSYGDTRPTGCSILRVSTLLFLINEIRPRAKEKELTRFPLTNVVLPCLVFGFSSRMARSFENFHLQGDTLLRNVWLRRWLPFYDPIFSLKWIISPNINSARIYEVRAVATIVFS